MNTLFEQLPRAIREQLFCQTKPQFFRFVERSFSGGPYLYPELDDDTSEADELAAIEAGEINATSFCYVGAVASERSALTR